MTSFRHSRIQGLKGWCQGSAFCAISWLYYFLIVFYYRQGLSVRKAGLTSSNSASMIERGFALNNCIAIARSDFGFA